MTSTRSAQVIINGGGIAGLVLANALSRQGIDFIVLEASTDIAPCVGAGICILPSGARILDQLEMFDDIHYLGGEIRAQCIWSEDGGLLGHTDSLKLLHVRQGYPMIFIERRILLQVLFDHLKEKNRILLGKRIVGVDSSDSQVRVRCTDDSSYTGSIAVGADGIHSTTRREMWRHLEKNQIVGISPVQIEKKTLSAQYSAVFGIATPTPNMIEGHVNRTFAKGYSFSNGVGKDARIFWFIFHDMGKKFQGLDIPRMNQSEIDQHVKPLLDNYVAGQVRLREIYDNTIRCTHVPLEEGVFNRWVHQRVACIGDSVHKTTPNLGQGGNGSIESAASLANTLSSIFSGQETSAAPLAIIEDNLEVWAKSRMQRMKPICQFGNRFTRLEAGETIIHRFLARWIASYKGDTLPDLLCETTVGAEALSFLPLPMKSLKGTMAFDIGQGIGASTDKHRAAMYCCALVISTLAMYLAVRPTNPGGDFDVTNWNYGSNFVEIFNNRTGSLGLWHSFQVSDSIRAISFFLNLAIFEVIWIIESTRSGNAMTLLNWSLPFSLLSHLNGGISIAVPAYFTICHFQSPVSIVRIPDCRTTQQSYIKVIITSLVAGYYAPEIWLASKGQNMVNASHMTLLLPPLICRVLHYALASYLVDTTIQTRIANPTADMPFIRTTYILCTLVSGIWHLWSRPRASYHYLLYHNGTEGQSFNIAFTIAMTWIFLEYKDLKGKGQLSWPWMSMLSVSAFMSWILGPAGALMLCWGIREECLAAFKRHLSENEDGAMKCLDDREDRASSNLLAH